MLVWDAYQYRKLWECKLATSMDPSFLKFHEQTGYLGVWNFEGNIVYTLPHNWRHRVDLTKRREFPVFAAISGLQFHALGRNRGEEIAAVAMSRSAEYLAFSLISHVYLYHLATDTIHEIHNKSIPSKVRMVFYDNDLLCANISINRRLYGWSLATKQQVFNYAQMNGACFHPTLPLFATTDGEGASQVLSIWKIENAACSLLRQWACQSWTEAKAFDSTGALLATGGVNCVDVWRFADDPPQRLATIVISGAADGCLTLSDGGQLAIGSKSGDVWISNWQEWLVQPNVKPAKKKTLVPELSFNEAVKKIWYDSRRQLYWICTQNGVFIHRRPPAKATFLHRLVNDIYPLPWRPGYSILAAEVFSDFEKIAVVSQSGEVGVLPLNAEKK